MIEKFFMWLVRFFFRKSLKKLIEKEIGDRQEHISYALHERHNEHVNPKTGEKFKSYGFKLPDNGKVPWHMTKDDITRV